eukprot:8262677-Pyramimonas_sp.AAC.1
MTDQSDAGVTGVTHPRDVHELRPERQREAGERHLLHGHGRRFGIEHAGVKQMLQRELHLKDSTRGALPIGES